MKDLDDITAAVVDAAMKIHMELGPGLLESVYEVVLARALERRGFRVERLKAIQFEYNGMIFLRKVFTESSMAFNRPRLRASA